MELSEQAKIELVSSMFTQDYYTKIDPWKRNDPFGEARTGFEDGYRQCCCGFYGDNCETLDTPWAIGYNGGWQVAKSLGLHGVCREEYNKWFHERNSRLTITPEELEDCRNYTPEVTDEVRREIFGEAIP